MYQTEIIKKNQSENLELKNTFYEILKNAIYNIGIRMDKADKIICELEDRNFEIIRPEKYKGRRVKKAYMIYGIPSKRNHLQVIGVPEGE